MAEQETTKGMKPIWFFVGLILLFMGLIIFISGLYYLFNPSESNTVLTHLHPDVWWGGLMVVAGIIFIWTNRNVTVG